MVTAYVAALRGAVSTPRLDKYRPIGGSDLEMAVNYFWNIALSEALYPSLAALEVGLRNGIHGALSTAYGTELWYYTPNLLEPQQLREFSQARLKLYRAHGNTPTAGLIVAELNFGFWTTLLSRNYHGSLWNPNNAANLRAAFPNVPKNRFRRDNIHQRCNDLRFLRNRVMHHEPISHRHSLPQEHSNMMGAIEWVSPTLRVTVDLLDRFPDVHQNGRARIEADLRKHLGVP